MSIGINRENALSDALGAIFLVAVVGMAVTILGVAILSQPPPEKIPSLNADITTIGRTIQISHNGGDSLEKAEMAIIVDGSDLKNSFLTIDGAPWSTWAVGDSLYYTVPSGQPMPLGVTIFYIGGSSARIITSMGVPQTVSAGGLYPTGSITPTPTPVPAPVADFNATPLAGPIPLAVSFMDLSTGSPTGWNWTFGDIGAGNTSTLQSPSHSYTIAGIYSVTLVVSNAGGNSSLVRTNYINAATPLAANFTGTPTSGPAPLSVSFTDTSTGSPTSWNWIFGDIGAGNSSTFNNPSHTFTTPGKYSVNLTVWNTFGSNTLEKTNFINVTPTTPWYNCGWGNRKNITIDKSRVSGTLSNFPVLINLLSDGDLAAYAQSNGNDILFTSSDGTTKLSHEIETYTSSTGALVAWVKVPTIQSSANTTIYMYYKNPGAANQQNPTGVWDSGFKAVWHLKENPAGAAPQMKDSTSNANDGTSFGTMTTSDQVAAKVNGGLDFDGSNDYLSTNYVQTSVTAYTIEAWIKTSTTSMQRTIVQDRGGVPGSGAGQSLTLSIGGTYPGGPGVAGGVGYGLDSNSIYIGRRSTSTVHDNNWHHVVGVWTAPASTAISPTQFSIYIDGNAASTADVTVGTAPSSPLTGLGGTLIGRHAPWDTYLTSLIDEVRISNTVRSSDWIKTEYNNQNSPSTFYYLNTQEQWTC